MLVGSTVAVGSGVDTGGPTGGVEVGGSGVEVGSTMLGVADDWGSAVGDEAGRRGPAFVN